MKLTKNETMLLARRRRGFTQVRAARAAGISVFRYGMMENGVLPVSKDMRVSVGRVTPAEHCLVMRLRAGLTQVQVGKKIGRSRVWVNRMENGVEPPHELVEFWGK